MAIFEQCYSSCTQAPYALSQYRRSHTQSCLFPSIFHAMQCNAMQCNASVLSILPLLPRFFHLLHTFTVQSSTPTLITQRFRNRPKSHDHANSTPCPSRSTGPQAAAAQPASCTTVPKKTPTQLYYCIATVLHKLRAPSPYLLSSCDRHTRPSARHCARSARSQRG